MFSTAFGKELVVIESGAGFTVSVVMPVTPDNAAVMVVVPADVPEASPAELIVATDVLDDVQVTWPVRFCVLPFE